MRSAGPIFDAGPAFFGYYNQNRGLRGALSYDKVQRKATSLLQTR